MTSLIRLLPAMLTTTTLITAIIFTPVPVTAAALAPPPPWPPVPSYTPSKDPLFSAGVTVTERTSAV